MTREDVLQAKLSFLAVILLKQTMEEFRSLMEVNEKYYGLSSGSLQFLENYFSFQSIFESGSPRTISKQFPKGHYLFSGLFVDPESAKPELITRKVSKEIIFQILKFYSIFVSLDGTSRVPFLTAKIRETCANKIIIASKTSKLSQDVFDEVALVALHTLFSRCFPKYLALKSISLPIMKIITAEHKIYETRVFAEENKAAVKQSLKDIFKPLSIFKFKGLSHSKECFISTLRNPKTFKTFEAFVKVGDPFNILESTL